MNREEGNLICKFLLDEVGQNFMISASSYPTISSYFTYQVSDAIRLREMVNEKLNCEAYVASHCDKVAIKNGRMRWYVRIEPGKILPLIPVGYNLSIL